MELIKQLEYPLPILKILAEKIVIETSGSEDGSLLVDNIGGGILSGRVMSNSPALRFRDPEFSGNQVSIVYTCSTDGCKPGDVIQSEIVVMSNGGEKSIPLIIKVIPAMIVTAEDIKITSQKDFLAYAKKYPAQARKLFTSPEFMMWLSDMGYEFMDIFEYLVRDSNKERALENFFILGKLKNRAVLSIANKTHYINVNPEQKDLITGEITVHKTGWGYIEADVITDGGEDWLSVTPECLSAGMFSQKDIALIKYSINTAKLKGKMSRADIRISGGLQAALVVKKKTHISISSDKSCYDSEDSGKLRVVNNCGGDIMLDISVRDGFVKFEGKRYYMGATAEIPFNVKLSTLQMAQIGLKRQPFFETEIYVTTNIGSKQIKRTVRVAAAARK
jgi:hypothetical protein